MRITYTKVGTVIHYYDKIGVAIILLTEGISVGDHLKFIRGGEDLFSQEVASMQVNHERVEKAGRGDEVGIKVENVIREGAEVFLEQ